MVCPHMGRFIYPFREIPSIREYNQTILQPLVLAEAGRRSRRQYAEAHSIPYGRWKGRLRPEIYSFLAACSRTRLGQLALADYHFLLRRHFDFPFGEPSAAPFLARNRGPLTQNGYQDAARLSDPLDPSQWSVSYAPAESRFLTRSLDGNRWSTYLRRSLELIEDDGQLLELNLSEREFRTQEVRALLRRETWRSLRSRLVDLPSSWG